jgi:hypothetical protein
VSLAAFASCALVYACFPRYLRADLPCSCAGVCDGTGMTCIAAPGYAARSAVGRCTLRSSAGGGETLRGSATGLDLAPSDPSCLVCCGHGRDGVSWYGSLIRCMHGLVELPSELLWGREGGRVLEWDRQEQLFQIWLQAMPVARTGWRRWRLNRIRQF